MEHELSLALRALKRDSQRSSSISRKVVYESRENQKVHSYLKDKYTGTVKEILISLCRSGNIPTLESHERLPGSLNPIQI